MFCNCCTRLTHELSVCDETFARACRELRFTVLHCGHKIFAKCLVIESNNQEMKNNGGITQLAE